MPLLRRRVSGGLPAVLGTPDLFATAYGNVGSSIYYALGVTAIYALGMTPITFAISGSTLAFTAATYAEATARFPEAGGSASFARRAFNEWSCSSRALGSDAELHGDDRDLVVHRAAVPVGAPRAACDHLGIGQLAFAAGLCLVLAVLNIRGIQESAKLNVFLALAYSATQALLVIVGSVLILSPSVLVSNVHWGTGPTLSSFLISIRLIGMVAYTGIETISNMAEEARDPGRDVPRSIGLVALAVFAIYAFLPAVALSAMPVHHVPSADPNTGSHFTSLLGSEFASDPVAGIVQNLGLGPLTTPVAYYVGVLAGTILIIATNAGIIGVSRLTYSMGQHRQFPNVLRTVHPKVFHALGRHHDLRVRGDRADGARLALRAQGHRVPREPVTRSARCCPSPSRTRR